MFTGNIFKYVRWEEWNPWLGVLIGQGRMIVYHKTKARGKLELIKLKDRGIGEWRREELVPDMEL